MRWWGVLVCLLLHAAEAFAQGRPAPAEPAGYREVIDEGLSEFEAKNFEEARALFARANTMLTTARTLRGLGYAEFELRVYRDAVAHLEGALASSIKPLDGAIRSETERILKRARGFVGKIQVSVVPADAAISVDGIAAGSGPERALLLDMGEHIVEVTAAAYVAKRQVVRVTGGEDNALRMTLVAASEQEQTGAVGATPLRPDSSGERRLYKNPWLWTALGVVLAGAGVGLAFGLRDPQRHPEAPYGGNTGVVFEAP